MSHLCACNKDRVRCDWPCLARPVVAIDLPARPPRRPDGTLNTEQLAREYDWEHKLPWIIGSNNVAGISYSNGNKHLTNPPTFDEYVAAVNEGNSL